jgi:hypothetical protein
MLRGQYNLLCQHLRKELLEERFKDMEIKKAYNE